MLVIKKVTFLLLFFILFACNNQSIYKDYTQTQTGLYYKLQSIGEGKRKATSNDYMQLIITYKSTNDSVFMDSYSCNETGMVILPYNLPSFKGSFEEGLTKMNEGDSVSFIVNADSLFNNFFKIKKPFFIKQGEIVKIDVRLHKILNQKEYDGELNKFNKLVEDRDIEEQRKLKVFLNTSSTPFLPISNGIYFFSLKKGNGERVKKGDLLKIQYKGCFLNGKQFESTYDRAQPMEYTFGEQGQVIKGIENAISFMNEGDKTKFIIPSQLAFGVTGSSTGIVPPYTTVIYEIELLKLNKHNN
ncbi:MAG: FKBP-type peptidyl-prolyl cis-trans isomerase [Bacteroidia bacterium]